MFDVEDVTARGGSVVEYGSVIIGTAAAGDLAATCEITSIGYATAVCVLVATGSRLAWDGLVATGSRLT